MKLGKMNQFNINFEILHFKCNTKTSDYIFPKYRTESNKSFSQNIVKFKLSIKHSLGYECPVGFDESEYYIKLLSRRNPETSATNPNCEDAGPGELIDKICRAFSRSPLYRRIPEITGDRNLEIEPQER